MYFENTQVYLLCQKQKYIFFKVLVYSLNNILNNVDN